jgi:hypothetical protein
MDIIEAGGGIRHPPQGFDATIEFTCGQILTALENHVLKEVGQAVLLRPLKAAAGLTPKVDADQGGFGQGQAYQFDPIGESLPLGIPQAAKQRG